MIFAKVEDLEAKVEVLVFPKLLEGTKDLWVNDKIVAIDGFVSFKDGAPKILAEAIYELHEKVAIPSFAPKDKRRGGFGKKRDYNGSSEKAPQNSFEAPNKSIPVVDLLPKTLIVEIPKGSDRSILSEIKEILTGHAGEAKVILKVPNNGSGYKEMNIKNKTEISPVVLRKLKELVGRECVYCK